MYYTYVLFSPQSRKIYIGQTNNISKRIVRHNAGQVLSTKAYSPWNLVHVEEYATRTEAMKREKFLKSGKGREWLHGILQLP